jgi:hypothetical protein
MKILRKFARLFRPARQPARKAATDGFKPRLETLEERITPMAYSWIGGQPGNLWSTGANWQPAAPVGGPSSGDTAVIPNGTCYITSSVTVAGLTIGQAGQGGDASVVAHAGTISVYVNGPLSVFAPQNANWASSLKIYPSSSFNVTGAITVNGPTENTQIEVQGYLGTPRTITVSGRASMLLRADNARKAYVKASTVTIQANAKLIVNTAKSLFHNCPFAVAGFDFFAASLLAIR